MGREEAQTGGCASESFFPHQSTTEHSLYVCISRFLSNSVILIPHKPDLSEKFKLAILINLRRLDENP